MQHCRQQYQQRLRLKQSHGITPSNQSDLPPGCAPLNKDLVELLQQQKTKANRNPSASSCTGRTVKTVGSKAG